MSAQDFLNSHRRAEAVADNYELEQPPAFVGSVDELERKLASEHSGCPHDCDACTTMIVDAMNSPAFEAALVDVRAEIEAAKGVPIELATPAAPDTSALDALERLICALPELDTSLLTLPQQRALRAAKCVLVEAGRRVKA